LDAPCFDVGGDVAMRNKADAEAARDGVADSVARADRGADLDSGHERDTFLCEALLDHVARLDSRVRSDQRLLRQHAQIDGAFSRQRMGRRSDRHDLLFDVEPGAEPRGGRRQTHERKIELAIEQLSFEAAVALNLEHDLDARMALFKILDRLWKERSGGNRRAADGEPAFS